RDKRGAFAQIRWSEVAALYDRGAEGGEIARIDGAHRSPELATVRSREWSGVAAHRGRLAGERGGGDSGNRSNALEEIQVEPVQARAVGAVLLIAAAGREGDGVDAVAAEAMVDSVEIAQGAREQAGSSKQHQR